MTERNPLPDCLSHLAQLQAEPKEAARDALLELQDRIDSRLKNEIFTLDCDEQRGGFAKAWDIVRDAFKEAIG